ncbi:phosphoserine phosphatase, chloroplastic [Tanacetum coccineum]
MAYLSYMLAEVLYQSDYVGPEKSHFLCGSQADKVGKSKSSSEVVSKEASTEIGKEKVLDLWEKVNVVCFDADSTVCTDKGIDELAEFCGVGKVVSEWTVKCALELHSKYNWNFSLKFSQSTSVRYIFA